MSSTHKKLTFNASSAIIQVAFTAVLYFFLYKYLLDTLGVKLLGVWSLILSFSSIANLANLGLTSGLVKFVAEYLAEKDHEKTGRLILTSAVSLAFLFLFISILVLLIAKFFLHFFVEKDFLQVAFSLLPYSLASLSISGIGGVFTSVLEGYQKNYLRNFIFIFSGIIMLVMTILLTPVYHLQGVAIAQLFQSLFVLLAGAIVVIRVSPDNRVSKWKWSNSSFKEMFDYGYKFQAVSICQLLYEPTTKMLLSKFGGLALLGHYEMASRLVNQFRALMVNANQVVIPIVAETAKTKTKEESIRFYAGMNRILVLFSLPLSALLVVVTPFISTIWIGNNNIEFNYSMYILTLSSVFNILCGPAYFSCMGEGRLNILVKAHASIAVLNLVFGFLLGLLWGGFGIILGWGLSLTTGSVYLIWKYNRTVDIGFSTIYGRNEKSLFSIGTIIIAVSIILQNIISKSVSINILTLLCFLPMFLFFPLLVKNQYIHSVFNKLRKK